MCILAATLGFLLISPLPRHSACCKLTLYVWWRSAKLVPAPGTDRVLAAGLGLRHFFGHSPVVVRRVLRRQEIRYLGQPALALVAAASPDACAVFQAEREAPATERGRVGAADVRGCQLRPSHPGAAERCHLLLRQEFQGGEP